MIAELIVGLALLSQTPKVELAYHEQQLITEVNNERARYGLKPLIPDASLMDGARKHTRWMLRYRSLSHASGPFAENIAMGQHNTKVVMRSWMNSSGHRANILGRHYTRIGVGGYSKGCAFWTQRFR